MKKCIINYASRNRNSRNLWFPDGQKRLATSLKRVNFDGDVILYDESVKGWPKHSEVPHGYKHYAMMKAKEDGYQLVLYVDASFWAVRSIDTLFFVIEKEGHVFQDSTFSVGAYSSDICLQLLKIDREIAFFLPQLCGGFMGLNLENKTSLDFLNGIHNYPRDGMIQPRDWHNEDLHISKDRRVKGHRTQTIASVFAWRLGLTISPKNTFFTTYCVYSQWKHRSILSLVPSYTCFVFNNRPQRTVE